MQVIVPVEEIYRIIGQRIKLAREQEGLTQEELARRLDVSGPLVTQWERGSRRISVEDTRRLAQVLHRPLSYLVGERAADDGDLPDDIFLSELERIPARDRPRLLAIIRAYRQATGQSP